MHPLRAAPAPDIPAGSASEVASTSSSTEGRVPGSASALSSIPQATSGQTAPTTAARSCGKAKAEVRKDWAWENLK